MGLGEAAKAMAEWRKKLAEYKATKAKGQKKAFKDMR
jgi:hypothetical protein